MSQIEKIIEKLLLGKSDNNFRFNEIVQLLESLGFNKRIKGDNFIFYAENINEILNIQPNGSKAKAYQVKQIRNIIIKYKLNEGRNV